MHTFSDSLRKSHIHSGLSLWEEMYRKAFPTFRCMVDHREDGDHQRAGVDRTVILSQGRSVWIDEKVRGRNEKTGKVYEDIALEWLSNDRTGAPGWVCKPLMCDYIAYAIAPLGRGYLLPVEQMQQAWNVHADEWKQRYPFVIRAPNNGYDTLSTGVPPDVLFKAIGACLRIQFAAVEI